MSEISSGLVAVRIDTDGYPFVRLSDAEAIIAEKDAEIIEQCRLLGIWSEREADPLGKVERQSAALEINRNHRPLFGGLVECGVIRDESCREICKQKVRRDEHDYFYPRRNMQAPKWMVCDG